MDLKGIIKYHRYEAEHAKRLSAHVAADFHIKAAEALEDIEQRDHRGRDLTSLQVKRDFHKLKSQCSSQQV